MIFAGTESLQIRRRYPIYMTRIGNYPVGVGVSGNWRSFAFIGHGNTLMACNFSLIVS